MTDATNDREFMPEVSDDLPPGERPMVAIVRAAPGHEPQLSEAIATSPPPSGRNRGVGSSGRSRTPPVRGVELPRSPHHHRTEITVSHANASLIVYARIELVRRVVEDRRPVAHVAAETNSRATGHTWLRRWREEGVEGGTRVGSASWVLAR